MTRIVEKPVLPQLSVDWTAQSPEQLVIVAKSVLDELGIWDELSHPFAVAISKRPGLQQALDNIVKRRHKSELKAKTSLHERASR